VGVGGKVGASSVGGVVAHPTSAFIVIRMAIQKSRAFKRCGTPVISTVDYHPVAKHKQESPLRSERVDGKKFSYFTQCGKLMI